MIQWKSKGSTWCVEKWKEALESFTQFFPHSLAVFNDESKHQKTKSNVREREREK